MSHPLSHPAEVRMWNHCQLLLMGLWALQSTICPSVLASIIQPVWAEHLALSGPDWSPLPAFIAPHLIPYVQPLPVLSIWPLGQVAYCIAMWHSQFAMGFSRWALHSCHEGNQKNGLGILYHPSHYGITQVLGWQPSYILMIQWYTINISNKYKKLMKCNSKYMRAEKSKNCIQKIHKHSEKKNIWDHWIPNQLIHFSFRSSRTNLHVQHQWSINILYKEKEHSVSFFILAEMNPSSDIHQTCSTIKSFVNPVSR